MRLPIPFSFCTTVSVVLLSVTIGCTSNQSNEAANLAYNTDLVQRFMSGMDNGNPEVIEEVMCPDLKAVLAGEELTRDELLASVRGSYEAFPDIKHHIEDLFAVGDKVVLRATDRGTHQETGKSVEFGLISIYQVADGCITRFWEEYDRHGLRAQLAEEAPVVDQAGEAQ